MTASIPGEHACGGIGGLPCDAGQFCLFPPGTCEVADRMGVCRAIPQACPDVWEPVCGRDAMTCGNACAAAMAGVSIDHFGTCATGGCGLGGVICPTNSFCATAPGMCGQEAKSGFCVVKPQFCMMVWMPVCGCDARTYSNACSAATAGVSVDYPAECRR